MPSTVFIVNKAGHHHQRAEAFGELVPMTNGYVSMGYVDRQLYAVSESIKHSTKEDWLLLSGPLLLNAFAVATWFAKHGQVRLLYWDKKLGYKPYVLTEEHLASYIAGNSHGTDGEETEPEADTSQD